MIGMLNGAPIGMARKDEERNNVCDLAEVKTGDIKGALARLAARGYLSAPVIEEARSHYTDVVGAETLDLAYGVRTLKDFLESSGDVTGWTAEQREILGEGWIMAVMGLHLVQHPDHELGTDGYGCPL
jgi:hypothetical protein